LQHGATLQAFDPEAGPNAQQLIPQLQLANSPEAALQGADALVLLTEWDVFKHPDFATMATHLIDKALFDGRNLYDPATVRDYGLYYEGIGRRKTVSTILNENEISS
jgi:UDPglucose 6-dehydrogenase